MGKFERKIDVITGSSSGIGLATAKRFVEKSGLYHLSRQAAGSSPVVPCQPKHVRLTVSTRCVVRAAERRSSGANT